MTPAFLLGLLGSLLLVCGAAYLDKPVRHPARSVKNWLFAVGGLVMFAYAFMNYQAGGSIFFVILEILVVLASILMMLNVPDAIDTPLLTIAGVGLVVWSLFLFEGYATVFFILGLSGIGIGYAMDTGSLKREVALLLGSALIAFFSYLSATWIFFWLNAFFALFSGYYAWRMAGRGRERTS